MEAIKLHLQEAKHRLLQAMGELNAAYDAAQKLDPTLAKRIYAEWSKVNDGDNGIRDIINNPFRSI